MPIIGAELMDDLYLPVAELMRQVAADVVMPRFRNLADDHIEEKAPDELVTIADKESEARLSEGLAAILPEAGIVGEEACEIDAGLIGRVGQGLNWIIDPIDGTSRSEEHTAELQTLMRISYAVFCLKKKKKNHNT